jgi:hypothetical protein
MKSFSILALAVWVIGCEPVEEDLPGHLAQLSVTTRVDDCVPARFTGDAGVQFFGLRADGGAVFTVSQLAQYSSNVDDGGLVESVQRQTAPFPGNGATSVGSTDACSGTFSAWVLEGANLLSIRQTWPGRDACTTGPGWLPQSPCTSERVFTFTPSSECNVKCVRISAAGEVSCGC